ncbi:YodL domain-containing protein [Bacillus songklensis]|uniref:YodL domain-containing protein n=1 Tax=Bacillus songklensis TaxID=1069116 RepID=A0ABV8B7P1_9BACI
MLNRLLDVKRIVKRNAEYDVTIMQTPNKGEDKGYRQVYRLSVAASCHAEIVHKIFQMFNVADTLPRDFKARYISTGDIVLIDEGTKGQFYYKLIPGGWKLINRVQVR